MSHMSRNELENSRRELPEANGGYERNLFWLCAIEAGWGLGGAFVSGGSVMPLMASALGASATVVGLLPALGALSASVPQIFAAHRASGLGSRLSFVARGHVWPTLAFLPMAAVMFYGREGPLSIAILYLSSLACGIGLGSVAPVWVAMVGDIAGKGRQSHIFGLMSTVGLVSASVGAWLAAKLFAAVPAPGCYAVAALIAFLVWNLFNLGWCRIEEVLPEKAPDESERSAEECRPPLREYLGSLARSVRSNRPFVLFLISKQLLTLHPVLGAFFVLYGKQAFGASASEAMTWMSVLLVAEAVSALLYSRVGDKLGATNALILSQLLLIAAMGTTLMASRSSHLAYVAVLIGFFYGTFFNARVASVNELAGEGDVAAYQAVSAMVTTPMAILVPALAGWAIDQVGYPAVLSASLAVTAAGTLLLVWLGPARKWRRFLAEAAMKFHGIAIRRWPRPGRARA